jgi:hypothetical protein
LLDENLFRRFLRASLNSRAATSSLNQQPAAHRCVMRDHVFVDLVIFRRESNAQWRNGVHGASRAPCALAARELEVCTGNSVRFVLRCAQKTAFAVPADGRAKYGM